MRTAGDDPNIRDLTDAVRQLKSALAAALEACGPPEEIRPGVYSGVNLPELLAQALTELADERGGVEYLVRHRPGCWEAEHVRRLVGDAG